MERNREVRRGAVAAVNGGLSRRRQRSSNLRDSPEEDGGMEMTETTRLRDRGSKKDRDRDRSSRSKRRRGERMLHGSNRDEGDETSEESVEEEDEDEEDDVSVAVRLPPPPPPPPNPASSSSSLPQNNHHPNHQQQNRKSFPTKVTTRTPPVWKADEMIGFSVPRKARSASTKRSPECWVLGGSGSGELIPRQASTSPLRLSPASTTQISPSSSNASARKKMKPMGGPKHRPPKVSKSPSLVQDDIEIEVAEVLFGMTRQFPCPPKQETSKVDSKEINGGSGNESKSRVSSPNAISPPPAASQTSVLPPSNSSSNPTSLSAIAPKRKRPRPVKFEDESPTSPVGQVALPSTSVSSSAKLESEQPMKAEVSSPRSEKHTASPAIENGGGSFDVSVPQVAAAALELQQELEKTENNSVPDSKLSKGEPNGQHRTESHKEAASSPKETPCADLDVNRGEETTAKAAPMADGVREEKFNIDLMVPPPERDEMCDFNTDHKSQVPEIDMVSKVNIEKKEEKKAVERTTRTEEILVEVRKVEKSTEEESNSKKQMGKERNFDLQLDLEKPDKDSLDSGEVSFQKQQPKVPKSEPKPEKPASSTSLPIPMAVAGWPGNFPPFGYMGQVPSLQAVAPMDGTPGSTGTSQPPSLLSPQARPKRCATHCYIAQNVYYHQRLARMNSFWPAANRTTPPMYGAKPPYNLNAVPPSDAFAGGLAGRNSGALQDNKGAATASVLTGPPSKERMPSASNTTAEVAQRKQLGHQQPPQPGSAANALPGAAFIFPINQQQAAAAAMSSAATRSGAPKSIPGFCNGAPSSGASSSAVMSPATGGPGAPMNLSFAGLPPNEAHQYLAILQNNAYPFPVPAHVAGAPPYRGASPGQAMPFFYPSQILHPSQLPQQHLVGPQQPPQVQQGHQNTSTSSGSSSSQKHPQQSQRALGGGASGGGNSLGFPATNPRQHLLPPQARQHESDKGLEDGPSTADGRVSQAQKSIYGHNHAMPIYSPNFALMSNATAAAAFGTGGGPSDKQSMHHHQQQPLQNQTVKVELTPSQAFTMPFAFSGAGGAPPGLDFSSITQNHALFQSFPEAASHGYHHFVTAAAAAQAAQQKKAMEDGKPAPDLMNASAVAEEERKMMAGCKAPASGSQHSLNFSKPDGEPPISSIIGNSVIDSSSRTLNLIPAGSNTSRSANRSGGVAPSSTLAATATVNLASSQQQQQQQLIQIQKHPQQLQNLHLQQQRHPGSAHTKSSTSSNSASVYSDSLPGGSTVAKYPQGLPSFPQSLIQGGSPTQSPQWKASTARSGTSAPAPSPAQSVVKNNNHLLQQPGRAPQQPLPGASHQTQISFGVNSMKTASTGGQHHSGATGNPSLSATAIAVGSPPSSSVSKTAGGSPRASASTKPGQPGTTIPLPQQSSAKSCVSSSSCKSSPVSNRNVPSILGHPHIPSAPSSGSKPQQPQQQPQQFPRPHQFPGSQLMFSNAYPLLQARSPQANAAAAVAAASGYYQRRPSEQPPQQSQQHQHQPNSTTPGSTGMLGLGPSALTLAGAASMTNDPAKAVAAAAAAANNMKGLPPPSLMQAAHLAAAAQSATGAPHHLIPSSFPYMMPPVSVKPSADQKPAAGNDNLHACWQPDKR